MCILVMLHQKRKHECLTALKKCGVCSENVAKYKCPQCLLPYCSVSCCRIHKETPCTKEDGNPPLAASQSGAFLELQERGSDETEVCAVIRSSKLRTLATSPSLRRLLEDSRLRVLLTEIASATVPGERLIEATRQPEFEVFANETLLAVGAFKEGQFIL